MELEKRDDRSKPIVAPARLDVDSGRMQRYFLEQIAAEERGENRPEIIANIRAEMDRRGLLNAEGKTNDWLP